MKLTPALCKFIASLEYVVGNECYNPNSYNGWTEEYGLSYRYPVHVADSSGEDHRVKSNVASLTRLLGEIDEDTINSMYYAMGTNELYIGQALISILEKLEERYGLDFAALEEAFANKGTFSK